ncbi:unnamed protein product [Mytilus coruscus]|uniref:CCHC-type domain-containing protein n=1 Tax=Mytilus coruscus TaxID=42192 RepID=A0A6J8DEG8_MYTCO|nr:unnamed protein product [Mytilus coruscus]
MFECKQSEIQNKQFTKPNPSKIPHPGYNNQNNGPRGPLICFRCGQPGHMARNCTGNPKRNDIMDVKPPPPFNSQPPPPFNSSWAQNRPNYDQRGAYSYNGPPAQDFGTPKVINKEVKFTGGNDSSDVKDDRSLVKKNCSQEEEKSLDVTNEKSLVPEIDEEVEVSSKVKDETPQSNKLDIIGRQVVRCDGVYIEGSIQGVKVTFTADTGAARTVISTRIFKKIPQSDRPKLEKSNTLASANGQPLVEKGKAVFNLELGNLSLAKELVVAEIEDDVLLGLDILMKGEMGPADIKLTEGVILLNGVTIPCIQIGQPEPVRKVRAADNFIIPPQSEILIDAFVDKTENDPTSPPQDYLIEPSPQFIENHPVMMASSLVDICHDVTNKVRLINPFDQEVQINQDTVVGLAEKVEEQPILLFLSENTKDSTNFDSVRRIQFESNPVTWQTNEGIIRNITKKGTTDGGKSGVVPPHLINLFTEASEGRSEKEQEAIANLLHKYATAFSAHETDLGLTYLTEHSIDTGDARPIKQAPRRVPLAFAEEERKIITQMLDQGIIENSSSPWASPLLLIRKKNGKIRPAVDYRKN